MKQLIFKIRGMDCAEEVAALKHEVGPLVGGEELLSFDLIQGKMILSSDIESPSGSEIVEAVKRTGMQAIPWEQHVLQSGQEVGWWERHGRLLMVLVSATCLLLALLFHVIQYGIVDALAGGASRTHAYPMASLGLYVVTIITGGWFIFPKAWFALRRLRPDMNLLMVIAVMGAMLIGEWFEGAVVTWLFAIALLLESWSVKRARRAIRSLLDLSPTVARYICPNDGDIEEKPVEEVPLGVTVLVRPGEKIPLDGVLTKGRTTVNQAPITGESMPVSKQEGDELFAGTINGDGAIELKTTHAAEDTTLARIIRMVEEAQSRRANSEQWVERFAYYYTPLMMGFAILIAVGPPLLGYGTWGSWLYQALVILVIACPCALVISTPVSIVAGLSAAARQGVLIKGGVYLEAPARIKIFAVDKTGTLTKGEPEVQHIIPWSGHNEQELLQLAAALESHSDHPLARAILRKAHAMDLSVEAAEQFQVVQGKGAEGTIGGRSFWIGSHRMMHEKIEEPPELHKQAEEFEHMGHSIIFIGNEEHVCGLISVADALRPGCKEALTALHEAGITKIVMLTGDNDGTARTIAKQSGVDEYKAELLPEDKTEYVTSLVLAYQHVVMVGDGVNDAPAMAAASLGIAMGAAGTDAAIETADIALMSDDLSKLGWLVHHSRRTLSIIRQNIGFALGLKLVFIALALWGVATLWMAIAADMGASLLVIFNGLRLLNTPNAPQTRSRQNSTLLHSS